MSVAPFGMAFGIAAVEADLALWQAAAFSILVFAGSAQFAAVGIIGDGGSAISAVTAGLLLNLRSLAFGIVMASALRGPVWKRAIWSQVMVDESTAVGSAQLDLRWRRYGYLCCGAGIFVVWNLATLIGATVLSSTGSVVTDWGLDAAIPATFLALLWPRLREVGQRRSALAGGVTGLALVPFTPAGLPVVLASVGVLAGWRTRRGANAAEGQPSLPGVRA